MEAGAQLLRISDLPLSCSSFFWLLFRPLQPSPPPPVPPFFILARSFPQSILEIHFMFIQSLHQARSAPGQMFPKHWEVGQLV